MYQIDNSTAAQAIPASTAAGNKGYFTDGNPATGTPATILPAEFMNMLMMENINVLSAAGIQPDKSKFNQLALAISTITGSNLTWANLGGKPNTVSGFGITDAATKTELSNAVNSLVPKTGGTLSGALILSNGSNDSPEFGWETPTTKVYVDVVNNSVRFFGNISGAETLFPLVLNLQSKLASVFGYSVWHEGNLNPATKADKATTLGGYGISDAYTRSATDSLLSGKAAKATTLAGYGITNGLATGTGGIGATAATSELANAFAVPYGGMWSVTPATQGVPFSYGSLLHAVYDANQSWTQIAADMAGGGIYWRGSINGSVQQFKRLWDSSNFDPLTRITAINCPQAGFTDNTTATPFMTHSNGTTVGLARADSVVGVGQSWQDVTASRVKDVNYTNSTSRPIMVSVGSALSGINELRLIIDGLEITRTAFNASTGASAGGSAVTAVVPAGSSYRVSTPTGSIGKWSELR